MNANVCSCFKMTEPIFRTLESCSVLWHDWLLPWSVGGQLLTQYLQIWSTKDKATYWTACIFPTFITPVVPQVYPWKWFAVDMCLCLSFVSSHGIYLDIWVHGDILENSRRFYNLYFRCTYAFFTFMSH